MGIIPVAFVSARPHDFTLEKPIRGFDAGILVLDVRDNLKNEYNAKVSWSSSNEPRNTNNWLSFIIHKGKIVIPIDASHRWLMNEQISNIRILIEQYMNKAYRSFYLKPMTIFRILLLAKNSSQFFDIIRRGVPMVLGILRNIFKRKNIN